jgi:hypothetical protein
MSQAEIDADKIPTLTDLVQPGTESTPRPVPEPEPAAVENEAQLDMPLDAPDEETESVAEYGQPAEEAFEAAIAEAEGLRGMDNEAEETHHAPTLDIPALLEALEPRIEALVDEALERQARQSRDEIVSSVLQALREELTRDTPADGPWQD